MFSNFLRLWAYLGVIGFLLLPSVSQAQEKSKILVLPYQTIGKGVTTEILEQTTNLVGSELESSGVPVLEGSDSIKKIGGKSKKESKSKNAPTGDRGASDKAKKLIARGKTDVEDQEFEAAINNLKKAIRLLDDNGDAVDDLSVLSDAYLLIATAYFQEGDEDEADDSLVKAVHYSPDKKLRPNEYPPIFIRSFERARYNVLRRPRARLEIKAERDAQILLDGRRMGRAPLVLTNVLPGTHWVSAQTPGETPHVKKLLVRSKRTITVSLGVEDGANESVASPSQNSGLVAGVASNEINRSHIAQLQTLGRKRGVEFVLFGGIHKTSTAYNIHSALVNVQSGEVGRITSVAFDLDLLTAQIEVYKLADDIRQQTAGEDPLTKIISAATFRLDPKLNLTASKSRRAIATGAARASTRTVSAAPKEIRAPVPKAAPPPPPTIASAGDDSGRAPLNGGQVSSGEADVYDNSNASGSPPIKTGNVIPKDEADSKADEQVTTKMANADNEDKPFLPRRDSPVFTQPEEGSFPGESMWWLWVVVGVAVAGAGGTGAYFLAADSGADTGELTIRW